jgi:hypothetical protein
VRGRRAPAAALAASPPGGQAAAIAGAGWSPVRAGVVRARTHDVIALRGTAAARVRLPGAAPDLDGFAAGRELLFSSRRLTAGKAVRGDAALCTAGFLVRFSSGRLGGLTAAHCGGLRRNGRVARRYAGMRRPPQPGIVLGRVVRMLARSEPLDVLALPVHRSAQRPALPIVDRGLTRPPWIVTGTARPLGRRAVCLVGRTSGADHCGHLLGARARRAELLFSILSGALVVCTDLRARPGDSGGPVYTAPRADGTVRALGLVDIAAGPTARMCFTPIAPALRALRATLAG